MAKHIIAILDDVGLSGVGHFAALIGTPNPPLTPVMDSIAVAGVAYPQFRTEPACSPTRTAMLTGQYPHRTGIFENITAAQLLPDGSEAWAPLDFDGTHTTGIFGKMHMGSSQNGALTAPLKPGGSPAGTMGFDEYLGPFANLSTNTLLGSPQTYFNWTKLSPNAIPFPHGVDVGTPGETLGGETAANYATTVTVDDAITWMEAQVGDFVCVVAFNAPHTPLHFPPSALLSAASQVRRLALLDSITLAAQQGISTWDAFSQIMTDQGIPTSVNAAQYDWEFVRLAVEAMDSEITRLLASSAVDLATDTTVWIVGDNGSNSNSTVAPEVPEHAKRTVYETGIRCPLIVRGAAVTDTGTCTGLVHAVDIWETIAAIESVSRSGARDSNDFSATFADVSASTGRSFSLSEEFDRQGVIDFGLGENSIYDDLGANSNVLVRALNNDTHKLIRFYDMRDVSIHRSELYDLTVDPLEQSNLLVDGKENFSSCRNGCDDYPALRRLQREFAILSPGL